MGLALKVLALLRWGSNPMRGSCQLLVHSQKQCVPPAVETDRRILPNMVEQWRKAPIHLTSLIKCETDWVPE